MISVFPELLMDFQEEETALTLHLSMISVFPELLMDFQEEETALSSASLPMSSWVRIFTASPNLVFAREPKLDFPQPGNPQSITRENFLAFSTASCSQGA